MATTPKPFTQRRVATAFLRVPRQDWAAVKIGAKTEFRREGGAHAATRNLKLPTPVVAYTETAAGHEYKVMVLEETWREPLGAISEESLQREGHPSVAHFRRYFMARTKHRFRPLSPVQVFRLRPLRDGDHEELGRALFTRVYGEFLDT